MLENFICCLKSCINCYRLFVTENGERRTENGERRTENGERRTEGEYGDDTDAVYER